MSEGNGSTPVCFLGMPSHGPVEAGAAMGLLRPRKSDRLHVNAMYRQGSLLNANCNWLWGTWAGTAQRSGRKLDYFAMLHADVCTPDGWLETLVDELEKHNLDVLSVAVPIKDGRGLTSCALGHPGSQDYIRAFCRITMADLFKLPETFTSADCGHPERPLLINTGCFVAKYDWRWAEKVIFDDINRLSWDGEKYVADTFPEDWHFGRQLYSLGLKVGCTRVVPVTHIGPKGFSSAGPWGDFDFDREYLSAPAIHPPKPPEGWLFPHDVPGWLSEAEGRALARWASGKDVVEIGSFCGRSTVCLSKFANLVEAVDTFDGRGTPTKGPTLERFRVALDRHKGKAHVGIHQGTSDEICPQLPAESYDLVFIDGAHDRESVESDINHALRLLRPNGLILFHDYRKEAGEIDGRWDPGVTESVHALIERGGLLLERVETLAVVAPPVAIPNEPCPV